MVDYPVGELIQQSRKGCPCCVFNGFLPPTLLGEAESNAQGDEANNLVPIDPLRALRILLKNDPKTDSTDPLILMDTHGHAQLERDAISDYHHDGDPDYDQSNRVKLRAIICAVEPADWHNTLEMAAKSPFFLPALGIHPWYLGDGLPEGWLLQLENLLLDHPSAIVGEIGLCKMARWTRQYAPGKAAALEVQRQVFQQQLQLAARTRRPVSVHCVNQHGVLIRVLEDILSQDEGSDPRNLLPPTIGMHSFTGTANQAQDLLKMETELLAKSLQKDPLFYFGFSHTVNYVMNTSDKSRRKGRETICSIPPNRLLVESDVHSSQDLLGGTAGAIAYVAWARNEPLHHIANLTARNGMAFVASVTGP